MLEELEKKLASYERIINRLPKLIEAGIFMYNAHKGVKRKYNGRDYYTHPLEVCHSLLKLDVEVEVLQAALLHDVIEDTEYTKEDIENLFGSTVADLVWEVTNQCEGKNRAERKLNEVKRLAQCSNEAKLIKLADRWHNINEMKDAPEGFKKKYFAETEELVNWLMNSLAPTQMYETENYKKECMNFVTRIKWLVARTKQKW